MISAQCSECQRGEIQISAGKRRELTFYIRNFLFFLEKEDELFLIDLFRSPEAEIAGHFSDDQVLTTLEGIDIYLRSSSSFISTCLNGITVRMRNKLSTADNLIALSPV